MKDFRALYLLFLALALALFLPACRSTAPRQKTPPPVAPPALQVNKAVAANEVVRTATAETGNEVRALHNSVVVARREAASLANTVARVKKEGAAAEGELAKQLAVQSIELMGALDESNMRAEKAAQAQQRAEVAVQQMGTEVAALQARAAAGEQALKQYSSDNAALRGVVDDLAERERKSALSAAEEKVAARRWRNTALIAGGLILIYGGFRLWKPRIL